MNEQSSKVRITLTVAPEVACKIEEACKKYGIPKAAYIILATLEKINKEENERIAAQK
jgi:hypothetical protein